MNENRQLLEAMITQFTRITTLIMIFAGIYTIIFWGPTTSIDCYILLQIPLVGLVTSVPSTLLFHKDTISVRAFLIRTILLYIYVNAVVLSLGYLFDWFRPESTVMTIGMILSVLAVFTMMSLISYFFDRRTSDILNEKLSEINSKEE